MDLPAHLTLEKWERCPALQIQLIEQQIVELLCLFLVRALSMRQH
jgi:hypothetical protein